MKRRAIAQEVTKTMMTNNKINTLKMAKVIKSDINDRRRLSERMSSRMVKCASVLSAGEFVGWQMNVPTKGVVNMTVFGTDDICKSDLGWIVEKTAKTKSSNGIGKIPASCDRLYELCLPVIEQDCTTGSSIGFEAVSTQRGSSYSKGPTCYSTQFDEVIQILREQGGAFRVTIGPANEEECDSCRKHTIRSFNDKNVDVNDYVGRPVKVRALFRLASAPSARMRTVTEEAVCGSKLRFVGTMDDQPAVDVWDNPLCGAVTFPDYAARIMILEPELFESVIGIELCEEEMKKIPVGHSVTKDKKAVVIGKAIDHSGVPKRIAIGEMDLRRHYQIIGQTGTGKSTLIATVILNAIQQGYGLTFFDPHGSTIDTVLKAIPREYADRVRVVRIGDIENPVPFNIWDSDDPVKEERTISDLCELFADIFDPRKEGIVGPRYERWLSVFAKASIAFLGRRASLESIAVISQSKDNMLKVSKLINDKYPELVETIKQEYGFDRSADFQQTLNWYLCKFQRLTSVEQLRKTLGAGANALDFAHTIDTNTVTLIDLASPTIGTLAARLMGSLMLMKLWNAILVRKNRDMTHMVVVDEAALFQTNPMPKMLAESRKFGVSMVLCHQHTGQLSPEIRDALEANSANFSAFRLSTGDAANAAIRFDDPQMRVKLTRLSAFNAITTLSINGRQTAPFTLETIKTKPLKDGEIIAKEIEDKSKKTLVDPYREFAALTPAEIVDRLNRPKDIMPVETECYNESESDDSLGLSIVKKKPDRKPDWLEDWNSKYKDLHRVV